LVLIIRRTILIKTGIRLNNEPIMKGKQKEEIIAAK
jgi:hypothetical protein